MTLSKVFFTDQRLSMLLGIFVGILSLHFLFKSNLSRDIEDFALGEDTKSIFGKVDGKSIHCSDFDDVSNCLMSYHARGGDQPVFLWLGNSQLHAINQYLPGQESSAQVFHKKLQDENKYSLTFSQPNANLQEHFLLLSYLINQLPIKTLILPLVFDDMREDGVRSSLLGVLKDSSTVEILNNFTTGKNIITNEDFKIIDQNLAALEGTVQEKVENTLNSRLNVYWPLWAKRPIFRGVIYKQLYFLRNSILGINAQSLRKKIPGRYKKNLAAFVDILRLANANNINILAYVAPIRNDVQIPYLPDDYNAFKEQMSSLTFSADAKFINLENIVAGSFWGNKKSTKVGGKKELDFMHFQAAGHQLLATILFNELIKLDLDLRLDK